jgi:ligand-binding sensor domain-containing protein
MLASLLNGMLMLLAPAAVPSPALATAPYFRRLDVADGLPSSTVWKLAQDRDGYIWIGTADGLARYDGVGFRSYRHAANEPDSLAGNDVSALFVDHQNRLWCGGEGAGLNLLGRDGRFTHFRHADSEPWSLAADDVWAIGEDADGAIWVGTYAGGLDRFDEASARFVHFRHDPRNRDSPGSDNVLALRRDRAGTLWIGTDAGVDVRDARGHFHPADFAAIPGKGAVNAAVFADSAQGMLVGTRRGLVRIDDDLRAHVVESERLRDPVVYGTVEDNVGAIWIGTRAVWRTAMARDTCKCTLRMQRCPAACRGARCSMPCATAKEVCGLPRPTAASPICGRTGATSRWPDTIPATRTA